MIFRAYNLTLREIQAVFVDLALNGTVRDLSDIISAIGFSELLVGALAHRHASD
ncbi:hypothetical protein RX327_32725 [Bradyrhizobium sp. BEA-2-5]|uniref:hypothetical protein n=1 Tax=Bradyrhizobium sp. BEA-2-5 TaxID=3080015 RepID=UPI00293EA644|nr:hypothetical protein [Bradyrhizobium sp. BEA-2-5]WOH80494.1 hypothetical protein RX327_32725 [Bradyrhizobium sp. BEA-2-5]